MTRTWLGVGLAALSILSMCGVACGGETSANEAETSGGPAGSTGAVTADEPPSATDPCSILGHGSAKDLPAGITLPAGAPAMRLTFELTDQRVELTKVDALEIVPAWTSKDTQIFTAGETAGSWIETRDASGSLRYQRNLFDPLNRRIEVAPDPNNPADGWKNSQRCSSSASIRVEIPSGADEVRLYASEREDGASSGSRPKLVAWYRLR